MEISLEQIRSNQKKNMLTLSLERFPAFNAMHAIIIIQADELSSIKDYSSDITMKEKNFVEVSLFSQGLRYSNSISWTPDDTDRK